VPVRGYAAKALDAQYEAQRFRLVRGVQSSPPGVPRGERLLG
jgi:hypothetical protein